MIDLETPSPTDEHRKGSKWVVVAGLLAAAAVVAIALVAIRNDDPVSPADQPSPTVTALPSVPPRALFGTPDEQFVPGTYYLEVIEKLYKRNELAAGNFVALGQKIELSRLQLPMYLLAASADEVVAPEQLLAVERLVGTPPEHLRREVAPCNHLGLFMGKQTLEEYWPRIVHWLNQPSA